MWIELFKLSLLLFKSLWWNVLIIIFCVVERNVNIIESSVMMLIFCIGLKKL